MKSDDFIWEVGQILSRPSQPQTAAGDAERARAALIRSRTAWTRVLWKISDLEALNRLRDAARDGYSKARADIDAVAFDHATPLQSDEFRNRLIEVRVILAAYLTETKVLLDLLAAAVIRTLGEARGFRERHGGIGTRLAEYAEAVAAPAPDPDLVERARKLDMGANLLRDKIVTHPQPSGEFGRAVMQPRVGPTTALAVISMYPQLEPSHVVVIEELDRDLEDYTHALLKWLMSAQSRS